MNKVARKLPDTWVFLRGLTREQRHWGDFPKQFEQKFKCSVICLDIAGNGKRFQETSPTSIDAMLEQFRSNVQISRLKQAPGILALSMGAMIASQWQIRYSDEVAASILINTSMKPFSPFYHRLRPSIYLHLLFGLTCNDKKRSEQAILTATSNLQHDQQKLLRQWVQYATQCPVSGRNTINQLLAAARYLGPQYPGNKPTLLLASQKDRLVNVECSKAIAKAWQCPVILHPEAGHDLPLDDPDWTLNEIEHWLLTTLTIKKTAK